MSEIATRPGGTRDDGTASAPWPYRRPWGARGFLKLSREIAGLAGKKYPGSRFVLSTWLYDTPPEGEWEGLSRALAADGSWVDAIMADAHEDFPRYPLEHPAPGGKPLLNFPEISMWGQFPWGAYGANPLPARFERLWRRASARLAGGSSPSAPRSTGRSTAAAARSTPKRSPAPRPSFCPSTMRRMLSTRFTLSDLF